MTPAEISKALKGEVIDSNCETYRCLFRRTDRARANDPYWKQALTMFDHLSPADQEILFKIVRQVAVDSVANVLAIVDGVSRLKGQSSDFCLTLKSDASQELNGELQESFLRVIEEEKSK